MGTAENNVYSVFDRWKILSIIVNSIFIKSIRLSLKFLDF